MKKSRRKKRTASGFHPGNNATPAATSPDHPGDASDGPERNFQREGIEPAFGPDVTPIVFACDNKYALFVGVAVQNIIILASQEERYDILILETQIETDRKEAILRLAAGRDNIRIRFIDISSEIERYGVDKMPIAPRFTKEVFAPLFIPHLCRRYHKALSIDPDILLVNDISELLKTDLTGYMLGAVIDFECTVEYLAGETPSLNYRDYIRERLDVPYLDFFNSGVVLFNIKGMIEEGTLERCIDSIAFAIRLPDQDALNWASKGRVLFLDPVWNVQMFCYMKGNFNQLSDSVRQYFNRIRKQAKMLHFTFAFKPWFHENYRAWWSVARRTEFYETIKTDFLLNKEINPIQPKPKKKEPTKVVVRLVKDG